MTRQFQKYICTTSTHIFRVHSFRNKTSARSKVREGDGRESVSASEARPEMGVMGSHELGMSQLGTPGIFAETKQRQQT